MDLLQLIIAICVLGLVWWAIHKFWTTMPPAGETVLTIAFVVVAVLCLLSFLGIGTSILHFRPNLR